MTILVKLKAIPSRRVLFLLTPAVLMALLTSNYEAIVNEKQQTKKSKAPLFFNKDAAGIDIGGAFHFVAVPGDRDEKPIRKFDNFTADLYQLADWLLACKIKTVAMESTGVDLTKIDGLSTHSVLRIIS